MYKSLVTPKRHPMMHKALIDLQDFERLQREEPEALQAHSVTAVLLALGSNYQAETYLPVAQAQLAALGQVQSSTAFQNPDFTATVEHPKPDYTNQCVHLALTTPMTLQQLQQTFKDLEGDCNRCRQTDANQVRLVTMDIDILMIKLADKKNSLSKNNKSKWIIMKDRYPFKSHETAGISELIAEGLCGK